MNDDLKLRMFDAKYQVEVAAKDKRIVELEAKLVEVSEVLLAKPGEDIAQCARNEMADLAMLVGFLTKTYEHFTNGRITIPNTIPSEVFSVAADVQRDESDEAVQDVLTEMADQIDESSAANADYFALMLRHRAEDFTKS